MTNVSAEDAPNVSITLTDGAVKLGILLNNVSGIRQLPRGAGAERKSVTQKTWDGGRGGKRYAEDTTKFYDSGCLWSVVEKQLTQGPLARHTKGYRSQELAMPGSVAWHKLIGSGQYLAQQVTPAATFACPKGYVILRRVGTPTPLIIELCSDSSGAPGTVLASVTVNVGQVTDWLSVFKSLDWGSSISMVAASPYWLKAYHAGTTPDHWEIGVDASAAGKQSINGSTWAAAPGLYYRLMDAQPAWTDGKLFEYKRQMYFCTKPRNGTSTLYVNGDRGVAGGSQSTLTLTDVSKTWMTNRWAGCVVLLTNGVNAGEWRKVASSTGDTLYVDRPWSTSPAGSSTEYVILGSEEWTAVTITLAGIVTDVTEANGVVYFAMGDSLNLRRYREYNNAGVWTRENADDGTNKAVFLETMYNASGALSVFRANNDTVTFSSAPAVTWPTNLTFGAATQVGSTDTKITSLAEYTGLWIGKEDALFALEASILINKLPQLADVRDENNCVNMQVWNTNLYFPFLNGWERLYQSTVDDIGPNRGAGMPAGRQGRIADWTTVLHRAAIAHNGGVDNISAILLTTFPGGDWHEIYRASEAGREITTVRFQSIPGLPNRLWFCEAGDLMYLYLPDDVLNPLNDPNMRYAWEGYVVSVWIDYGTPELEHFYHLLRLFSEQLKSGRKVEVDYQVDGAGDSSTWLRFSDSYFTSPAQSRSVGDGHVVGWRFRYRLRLLTETADAPCVINSVETRANSMSEPLTDLIIDITTKDRMMLLGGAEADEDAGKIVDQLLLWQTSGYPLTLGCIVPIFDGYSGHIDPVALVPTAWEQDRTSLVGSLTFKANERSFSCFVIEETDTITVDEGDSAWWPYCLTLDGALVVDGDVTIS